MICPNCLQQMKQYNGVGGGYSSSDTYITWELKYCGKCQKWFIEYYTTFETPLVPLFDFLNAEDEQNEYIINLITERNKNV